MTTEYIERKTAIEWFTAFLRMGEEHVPIETAIEDLKYAIPTVDAVPVVRCKDCKYSQAPKTPHCMLKEPDVLKCGCIRAACKGRLVYPTDFCSYGERD